MSPQFRSNLGAGIVQQPLGTFLGKIMAAQLKGFLLLAIVLGGCASRPVATQPADLEKVRQNADQAMSELDRNPASDPEVSGPAPAGKSRPGQALPRTTTGLRLDAFPSSRYLTALGSGSDRRQAAANARVEIAKIFESRIKSSSSFYEAYSSDSNLSGLPRQQQRISSRTDISTEVVVSGIRIAQVSRRNNEFMALAVLDREKTWRRLRKEIDHCDRLLEESLAQYKHSDDSLLKVKVLKDAARRYRLRQNLEKQMLVLKPDLGVPPGPVSLQWIETEMARLLLHDFKLSVRIEGDGAEDVQSFLVESLSRGGLSIVQDSNRAQVLLEGKISITPLPVSESNGKWRYVRWATNFALVDKNSGSVLASRSDAGRKGHLSLARARNQALYHIGHQVVPLVVREMTRQMFDLAGRP